jgi:hypothetical protein
MSLGKKTLYRGMRRAHIYALLTVYCRVYTVQCTVCKGGGVWGSVGNHFSAGVYHSVSDQLQNLQNCYTSPNKNKGAEGALDIKTPAAKSLYKPIFYMTTFCFCVYVANKSMVFSMGFTFLEDSCLKT